MLCFMYKRDDLLVVQRPSIYGITPRTLVVGESSIAPYGIAKVAMQSKNFAKLPGCCQTGHCRLNGAESKARRLPIS